MPDLSRRNLIRRAAVVTGAAVVASVTPAAGALADTAAKRGRHGDIRDIKHVMILMQENRSFDHYFGSLKGVRGFGDRSTITLPGGYSVWQQPTTPPGQPVTGTQYPWRLSSGTFSGAQPPSPEIGAQNYGGTSHTRGGATTPGEARRAELARLVAVQRQGVMQLEGELRVAEERQRNAAARRERAEEERRAGEERGSQLTLDRARARALGVKPGGAIMIPNPTPSSTRHSSNAP